MQNTMLVADPAFVDWAVSEAAFYWCFV